MRFADVIGNNEMKETFRQMVEANRLGHALLLCEEENGGAFPMAVALAQALSCQSKEGFDSCGECPQCNRFSKLIHPDLHFVFPVSSTAALSESEKKTPISDYFISEFKALALSNPYFGEQNLYDAIGIESKNGSINVHESRRIYEKLSLRSFEGGYKVMVIFLVEKMNQDAANKLLKLLEEPPSGTLFILITHNVERVLQTIRSRCQIFYMKPLSRDEKRSLTGPELANEEYSSLVETILEAGLAKRVSDTFPVWEAVSDKGREKQKEFCIYAENYIRTIFLLSKGLGQLVSITPEMEKKLKSFAQRIKPTFYTRAYAALESSVSAVESNSNAKLVFCDLCNRLLLYL